MRTWSALVLALPLTACATVPATTPADQFFQNLSSLCGKAYQGRIASPPVVADEAFADKRLVMHVRTCSDREIRIPFHVAEDRSRTWIIMRTATGLRLKHDHRHENGSEDRVTQYGGDSSHSGTPERQTFPADAFTRELLVRENNPAGVNNVWSIDVRAGQVFAYELRRPNRFFRVDFDLTTPVPPPPPPWGSR